MEEKEFDRTHFEAPRGQKYSKKKAEKSQKTKPNHDKLLQTNKNKKAGSTTKSTSSLMSSNTASAAQRKR